MLKIFTTQLTGIFSRIQEGESDSIEDGARLVCSGGHQRAFDLCIRSK